MPTLVIEIAGDASNLNRTFKNTEKQAKSFTSKATGWGKSLAKTGMFAGAAVGAAALTSALKTGFDEFSEAQKVSAQLDAALKSTGGAANVTAGHIDELGNKILRYSGIDDEAVKSADAMLLKFTNVRNEVGKGNQIFDRATVAIADYATRMNQGAIPSSEQMAAASNRIGKALNDPIKGLNLLTRQGVVFTEQQKKQVKAMVEAGNEAGAQKILMEGLEKTYGGAAKAAGGTFAGQIKILQESFSNITGEIVKSFMPALQRLLERANKWITNAKNQKKIVDAVKEAMAVAAGVVEKLKSAFDLLSKVLGGNKNAIIALVAAYATFKALQMASTVAKIASSFGLLKTSTEGATVATRGLTASMVGKAGLVGAVGLLSFGLTTAILKATGLDKKLNDLGGSAYDLAGKLGLVNDPMGQFKGKTILTPKMVKFLRDQAKRLIAGGMSAAEAAARIKETHPGVAGRDIDVILGLKGGSGRRTLGMEQMPRINLAGGTGSTLPFGRTPGRHLSGTVIVNNTQNFNAPTTDRHREARYALMATRAVFDS